MNAPELAAGCVVISGASGAGYELQRHLGAGAFGEVWLGHERVSGARRALKVVPNDRAVTLQPEVEKTRRATLACGAHHVPQFYEASQSFLEERKGDLFLMIAMEFIDGPTLEHLAFGGLAPRLPPPRTIMVVMRDMCLALSRLHQAGVIHGDVKGANILVANDGNSYLCDFGVSTFTEDFVPGVRMTPAGTPLYMAPEMVTIHLSSKVTLAPEVAAMAPERYGVEVDVWSLGVVAYELAWGLTPVAESFQKAKVDRPKQDAIFQKVISELPNVRADEERCPRELANFIRKALVMTPETRSSAADLLRDCFEDTGSEEFCELLNWIVGSPH